MSIDSANFDYEHFDNALDQLGALTNAAETHGIMCGFICAGIGQDETDWLDPIIATEEPDEVLSTPGGILLQSLFQYSFKQLQSFEFDLYLLLPDDEITLRERSEALGSWCQGFLTGLAMAEPEVREHGPDDLQETLQDLTKITMIDYEGAQSNEENEAAYADVQEYTRMATLLIHSILNTPSTTSSFRDEQVTDRIH